MRSATSREALECGARAVTGGGDSRLCAADGVSHPCVGGDSHPCPGGNSHLSLGGDSPLCAGFEPASGAGGSGVLCEVRGVEDCTGSTVRWDGADPPGLSGSGGGAGRRCVTMTVRGKGCMEDTTHSGAGGASQAGPACSEHTHQHNSPGGRPANARQGSHAFKRSSSSSGASSTLDQPY